MLDNNAPRGIVRVLFGHAVTEARERGWATLVNGKLLIAAEEAGFDLMVTSDKNIKYQQNLGQRTIALIVLTQGRCSLVKRKLPEIVEAVNAAKPGSYTEVFIPFD